MEFGRVKNYINGEWSTSASAEIMTNINPATGEPISEVPMSTQEEVNAAVGAARAAFEQWRRTPPVSRASYLFELKELL